GPRAGGPRPRARACVAGGDWLRARSATTHGARGSLRDRRRFQLPRPARRPRDPRVRPASYRWRQTRREERSGDPDGARAGDNLEWLAASAWRTRDAQRSRGGRGSEEAPKKAGRPAAARRRSDDRAPAKEASGSLQRRENPGVAAEPLARYCERRRCLVGPRTHRAAESSGRNAPCGSGSGALWERAFAYTR